MIDAATFGNVVIRKLDSDDMSVLDHVAAEVFDGPVEPHWARVFLDDPRHHLFVAVESGVVVGMVSAVDYVHPDKAPQLWINEVGVGRDYRRRGIARRLLSAMLAHGRAIGCTEAWLGTEHDNLPARRLYESQGCAAEPFVLYFFPLDTGPHEQDRPAVPDAVLHTPLVPEPGAHAPFVPPNAPLVDERLHSPSAPCHLPVQPGK